MNASLFQENGWLAKIAEITENEILYHGSSE